MVTLPLLLGFVGLEIASGLSLALAAANPGRRARAALLVVAALAVGVALGLLAWGAQRVSFALAMTIHPDWTALAARAVLAFAGALVVAVCLAFLAPNALSRAATLVAGLTGLAAIGVLDAVYGGAIVAGTVLSPVLGALALGSLITALALALRGYALGQPLEPAGYLALTWGVGFLGLQGFLLLGHVALGLPGPSALPLLHGAFGTWFWLRLGLGLTLPLVLGLAAQRIQPGQPARLAAHLVTMVGLFVFGELVSRLLLLQTGVLF